MMLSRNDPNYQVQSVHYRSEATKLSELRAQTDRVVSDAIKEGELSTAHEALEVLTHKTDLFNDLRQRYTPREIFMFAYGVEVINDYTVSFVLPRGTSRISMLREAQVILRLIQMRTWSIKISSSPGHGRRDIPRRFNDPNDCASRDLLQGVAG